MDWQEKEKQKEKRIKLEDFIIVSLVIVVVLILFASPVLVPPYFEAKAYTRVTGKGVSYWDAMWLELRIDCDK